MALAAVPAHAQTEAGDVLVRLRGIVVSPTEESSPVLPAFSAMPEVDSISMLSDHIGAELSRAVSWQMPTALEQRVLDVPQ